MAGQVAHPAKIARGQPTRQIDSAYRPDTARCIVRSRSRTNPNASIFDRLSLENLMPLIVSIRSSRLVVLVAAAVGCAKADQPPAPAPPPPAPAAAAPNVVTLTATDYAFQA